MSLINRNLTTNVTLMGGEDEVWFFMTSLAVEKACAPALYAIVDAQEVINLVKVS